MKKRNILLTVSLLSLTMSCSKTYTCECKSNIPGSTEQTVMMSIPESSKSNSKKQCENHEENQQAAYAISGGNYSCILK